MIMLDINKNHIEKFKEIKKKFFLKTEVPKENNWKPGRGTSGQPSIADTSYRWVDTAILLVVFAHFYLPHVERTSYLIL
jgi:hypothetical protein